MLQDPAGRQALQDLGARSVPVVARGGRCVSAQIIKDVVEFLGLNDDPSPRLSPAELAERYLSILDTAIRLSRQMPDACLQNLLPNRPRSWRMLMHHVFQVPNAFLDMEHSGETLSYESLVAPPPDELCSSAAIAEFGRQVRERFARWWQSARQQRFDGPVPTYFGGTTRHEMLERTVWHSAQHVRQLASLLEQAGVAPDRPLAARDVAGLPLTDRVWDSAG